jgi:hypothetical protein
MTDTVRLRLCICGRWRPFLYIPSPISSSAILSGFAIYAGGIYGQPGRLSTTPGSLEVVEDAADYYYVPSFG